MDLQTSLLCLGLVMGSALLLFIISTFGTRGQSYEEVVAESRRLAAQRSLLDDAARTKKAQQQQTKKNKKAGKKVKEKQAKEQQTATSNSEVESDGPVESGPEEDTPHHSKHGHVEFAEPTIVASPDLPPPKPVKTKKRGKELKVKPILMNKDDPSCVSDTSTPPSPTPSEAANHFEQIHPKDEFELFHSNDKEKLDAALKDKKESRATKHGKAKPVAAKITLEKEQEPVAKPLEKLPEPVTQETPKEQRKGKNKQQANPQDKTVPEKLVDSSVTPSIAPSQPSNLTTDKILKKTYPLEASAPLAPAPSPTPTQAIAAVDGSATNGPTVPAKGKKKKGDIQLHQLTMGGDGLNVNMLVRVLTTSPLSRSEIQILTDCLLNKQNGPLPEHSEWSEGPKDPVQKLKKQLAEKEKALTDEQEASQAVHAKLKELRASLNAVHSRCSQLVASSEEMAAAHRVELSAIQSRLQRATDEAGLLRQQVLQLQSKLSAEAEFTAQRSQMEMHIQTLSENKASLTAALGSLQAEIAELRPAHAAVTNELHVCRDQILAAQHHASELSRQLEEANRINGELEVQRLHAINSEQFVKQELLQANERLKDLSEAQAEVQHLSSLNSRSQQITLQNEKYQEELDRQNQLLLGELNRIKAERDNFATAVTELREELALQATPNGLNTPEKDDSETVEKAVAAACSELEAKHSQQMDSLRSELDRHRDKNNELITRNWKVMEALQAAEKQIKHVEQEKSFDTNNLKSAVQAAELNEQCAAKEAFERLFPTVVVKATSHQEWLQKFTEQATEILNRPVPSENDNAKQELEKQNGHLQALVDKYKRVIDDTEGVLSRLQNNVTQEEHRWAKQLLEKQQELDNLKKHSISKLQDKVDTLQRELTHERELRECLEMGEPAPVDPNVYFSETDDIERLKVDGACLSQIDERLHGSTQSLNGPLQLATVSTLQNKASKKRSSIAGWFRRKITFRRRKKEKRAEDLERRSSLGDERLVGQGELTENGLGRKSPNSSFHLGSKTL